MQCLVFKQLYYFLFKDISKKFANAANPPPTESAHTDDQIDEEDPARPSGTIECEFKDIDDPRVRVKWPQSGSM